MIKFVIIVFTLFCPVAFSVKHSFKMFLTATSGVPDFPEFAASLLVDEVQAVCCDSIVGKTEPKVNWAREFLEENPQHLDYYDYQYKTQSQFLKDMIDGLMKSSDNIGGAHILQQIHGCEWDDETLEVRGFNQFGYNGEDFIELDLQTRTWKASKQQASIFKQRWDADKTMLDNNKYYHLHVFPVWLKTYLHFAESFLQRTDLPSVSLLQKIPSSLVTCHATDFYPNRADLFWRKDGEELHEDVDKGEILPNHDGTFQMSVDLKISSIAPGDWEKYDCVFQMSGVKDDVITKLDKSVIRSNPNLPSVSLLQKTSSSLVTCHATGFYPDRANLFWRKDGVEIHEDVDKGEILPDHDGSFQMSVDLNISSIAPEDWEKYDCVFQVSGIKRAVIITLDKSVIRTNNGNSLAIIICITAAVVVLVTAVCGFIVYKKKTDKHPPSPVENKEGVQEEMLPKP